jgi:leucyl aminopeptidase
MRVTLGSVERFGRQRSPLAGVLVSSDQARPKWLAKTLLEATRAPLDAKDFTGRELESALVYAPQRLLLVGLGEEKKLTLETVRRAAAAVVRRARALKLEQVAVGCARFGALDLEDGGRAVAEGLVLGGYHFHGQKTDAPPKRVREATVHFHGPSRDQRSFARGLAAGAIAARAQCLARDLGNHPASVATPRFLANQARKLGGSRVRVRVLQRAELERRKYGGLLGVARGSHEPPVFVELDYRPRSYRKTVCLIGKGLTFDTGGISLKPAQSMEEMKYDMCGGAAVLGAFHALRELQPKVRVVGLMPSTENMPGGGAIKPGDVLTTYGGITVEVTNTDAEGRLILADALARAKEFEPDYTVDLATLTGACVVALGHKASGLFCAHDDLATRLKEAGEQTGERLWPLPLWDEYLDEMKSSVADVKNSGTRYGGAATAAAFLKKFAGDLVWAHLDVAGTAWDTPRNELYDGGASGVAVRMLLKFLEGLE